MVLCFSLIADYAEHGHYFMKDLFTAHPLKAFN